MYSYDPYYEKYLAHYGVKGMHWGVRRYQNPDGTLTQKGRKILDKKKKKLKTYKALAIGLGVSAAAIGGYAAYKTYGPKFLDTTLKKGHKIATITSKESIDDYTPDHIYAAVNKKDADIYKKYHGYLKDYRGDTPVQVIRETTEDIRIAADKNARKTLVELYNKNEAVNSYGGKFKDGLEEDLRILKAFDFTDSNGYGKMADQIKNGSFDINNKKNQEKLYNAFNKCLAMHDEGIQDDSKNAFFKALSGKGYAGVKDVNDRIYSGQGYRTDNPVIIFQMDKLKETNVNLLNPTESDALKAQKIMQGNMVKEKLISLSESRKYAIGSGLMGGAGYVTSKQVKELEKSESKSDSKIKS